MIAEKTALYRHFDAAGALLYVGISVSAASRLEQHMRGSEWAAEITAVRIEYLPTREAALSAERAAIIAEVPAWNKAYGTMARREKARCGKRSMGGGDQAKSGFVKAWVPMAQSTMGRLKQFKRVEDFRVLMAMVEKLNYADFISVSQTMIARDLEIDLTQVNRAIKRLIDAGTLVAGDRGGVSCSYMLDADFWRAEHQAEPTIMLSRMEKANITGIV